MHQILQHNHHFKLISPCSLQAITTHIHQEAVWTHIRVQCFAQIVHYNLFFCTVIKPLCFECCVFLPTFSLVCWWFLVVWGSINTTGPGHQATLVTQGQVVVTGQALLLSCLPQKTTVTAHLHKTESNALDSTGK